MRCCGSSTTSTVPNPTPRGFAEATLFAAVLKPLAAGMGFFGDIVVEAVARDLFLQSGRFRDARS